MGQLHALQSIYLGVLIAILAVAMSLAAPPDEQKLIDAAYQQMDTLLGSNSKDDARIQALYALKAIQGRLKKLADADPRFKQRSDTEEFRNMYEEWMHFSPTRRRNWASI